jgi:hypothetical protein
MQRAKKMTIEEILVERGIISVNQLNMAVKIQEPARKSGEELVDLGVISPDEFEVALELLLAEILVGLGYADERDIFGSSRISVVVDTRTFRSMDPCSNEDLSDL